MNAGNYRTTTANSELQQQAVGVPASAGSRKHQHRLKAGLQQAAAVLKLKTGVASCAAETALENSSWGRTAVRVDGPRD